ncbi:MAG TPA: TlyA family RNA methyltransferase, partial [Acidiphilium sp.]
MRADLALVVRGLLPSRARAQAAIKAGDVVSGSRTITRPSESIGDADPLALLGTGHNLVSRGGLKLAHALRHFELSPAGRICLDIGASTGGFSQILLENDAKTIYAVDAGHNQLSVRLRNDPRMRVMEECNARYLTRNAIPDAIGALVCDVSFIGLCLVLPAGLALCAPGAFAIALIKPQFEAGRDAIGKGGIVRDPKIHRAVCTRIETWWSDLPGWRVLGLTDSPITGGDG